MHKDRLILLLLLTVFMLLGADCKAPWEDDDVKERPLPDRALASSTLVRAYYNTRTFPEEMRSIKIPENGSNAEDEDDFLDIEFAMGTATVEEVRVHWYLVPPSGKTMDDVELLCRVVAPDSSKSSWKTVTTGAGGDFNAQFELEFQYEFDGIDSAGTWHAQIRDYVKDEDGRCLFRNASIHINRGGPAVGGSDSDTLNLAAGNYGQIPEATGERTPFDIGWFGVGRMLPNDFTIASSFLVQSATIDFSVYISDDASEPDFWITLVSPSGNWHSIELPDTAAAGPLDVGGAALSTYSVVLGATPNGPMFNLNGEPSAGTWTFYIVDIKSDAKTGTLTNDGVGVTVPTANASNLTLTLNG